MSALLIFSTGVAVAVAFAANYPILALIIVGCAAWIFVESGFIVDAIIIFSDPKGYARHPFVAVIFGLAGGLIAAAISAFFVWQAVTVDPVDIRVLGLLIALFSFRVVWLAVNRPDEGSSLTKEER